MTGCEPRSRWEAARELRGLGCLVGAEWHARAACDLAPRDAEAQGELGSVMLARGEHAEARRTLYRALALDPERRATRRDLALACWRLRRLDEAEELYRSWGRRAPGDAEAHARLGHFLSREARDARAADCSLRRAVALDPDLDIARYTLGAHLARVGRAHEALPHLTRAARAGFPPAQNALGTLLLRGEGVAGRDPDRARRWLEAAARGGDAEAHFNLGMIHDFGLGVGRDRLRAAGHYARAAAQGVAAAQYNLAVLLQEGSALPRDERRAVHWFARAAAQRDAAAQWALGNAFEHGVGVEPDAEEALLWFQRAARQGHAGAQYSLGVLYDTGASSGGRDVDLAVYWLTRSAEQDHTSAQYYLGALYESGDGIACDPERARRWMARAAVRGHPLAHYAHAIQLLLGRGDAPREAQRALPWLERAARDGVAEAQNALGLLHFFGRGVQGDLRRAFWWFSLAAHQGHDTAQLCLGVLYLRGDGMPADAARGAGWLARAAQRGHPGAQRRLGLCYAQGIGVAPDAILAYQWTTLACDAGDKPAWRLRQRLARRLNPQQRGQARRLALAWLEARRSEDAARDPSRPAALSLPDAAPQSRRDEPAWRGVGAALA